MSEQNRKLPRLKKFDYSTDGAYFVTICSKDREKHFGEIHEQKMILNRAGEIVRTGWLDLPNHYRNCRLDEFVVMPNHFHGIVWIDNLFSGVVWNGDKNNQSDPAVAVGNGLKPFPTNTKKPFFTKNLPPKRHGLSEIIRGFKTFSSRRINESNPQILFRWQKSFHDRIVRDEDELNRIRDYIWQNPENWANDEENISE